MRFSKMFQFSGKSVRSNLDIYNIANGSTVRGINTNYTAWLTPTAILDPRLFKISGQIDF
jgi:hypothetical protein